MALLDRLENDRSLARFAGQFVPLKIVTDGNPEWGKWASKYPIDDRGIPRLYVVRADGEKLFGAVGSLPGDQLPQMMIATLKQAGRHFNNMESELLETSIGATQTAIDDGNLLSAALALSETVALGSPDELGSYAKPAVRVAELYETLQSEIDTKVTQAQDELSNSESEKLLDSLLVVSEAEAAYRLFPKLKSKSGSITRDLKKNKSYAEPLAQAEALVKARSLRSSPKRSVQRRASTAYSAVIRRFPGSRAGELARAELAEIDPDAKILDAKTLGTSAAAKAPADWSEPTKQPAPEFREWKARSGKFTTTAKYLQQKEGKVQLLMQNGKKIVVEIAALSDDDQTFLRQQL